MFNERLLQQGEAGSGNMLATSRGLHEGDAEREVRILSSDRDASVDHVEPEKDGGVVSEV